MVCPLLAAAGFPQDALAHYRKMAALDLRADGLWRHSPLAEAAWGRGNAFALLGLVLTLESLKPGSDEHEELLRAFRNLASNLAQQQDAGGMWRQVIDDSASYAEFTATAMIAWAYVKGVKQGWLDVRSYQPRISGAWRAIQIRTSDSGELMDVCESTGKQKSLEDYRNRHAIWGRDDRAGAMALSLAVSLTPDGSR
jgi:rhamnogalacturonyl hydrolase YesR